MKKFRGILIKGGVVLALAGLGLVLFVRPPSFLRVQEIVVATSLTHLSEGDLVRLSQVHKGDNLLTLKLSRVRKNLLRFPWVHEVQLFKQIPGRLLIEVEEQAPLALLEVKKTESDKNPNRYLINRDGEVFKKADPGDPKNLPAISLPASLDEKTLASRVRVLVSLLGRFDHAGTLGAIGISEIHGRENGDTSLFTQDPCVRVELGRGEWDEKLDRLALAWESIRNTVRRPKVIDLTLKKKILVKQAQLRSS